MKKKVRNGNRYCQKCGQKLDTNDQFCPSCGCKTQAAKNKFSSKIDKKVIVGVILGIIAIIFIVNIVMPSMISNVPLEEHYYNFLTISVPEGSDFSIEVDMGDRLLMTNKGLYENDVSAIFTKINSDENDTGVYKLQNTTQKMHQEFMKGLLFIILLQINTAKASLQKFRIIS